MARLLLPEQFGLVGMCSVFIAVAGAASELGMSSALIQKKDNADAEKMYSTAFWTGIVWGTGLYILLSFIVAPLASQFFKEPMLVKLIPALSLGVLLRPVNMVHIVQLTRGMNFEKIAKISNGTALIAGITSIICAYLGAGVWSLVINAVLGPVLSIPLFFKATSWLPSKVWKKEQFKDIFGFGAYSTGTGIFSTLTYNIDNLMIGRLLSANALGAYSLSFALTEQLRQVLSSVLSRVMYPIFGKNQDNKSKLLNYFLKIISFNALIIYPLMAFLILFGEDIILIFFGEKWQSAIVPLQILSLAMMVHLLVNSFTSLIRGLGKPRLEMNIIIGLTLFVLIPALYVGITYYGLKGAALAILVNKIFLASIGIMVLRKEINLKLKQLFLAIKNPVLGIMAAGAVVKLFSYFGVDELYFGIPIYAAIYGLILYWLEFENLKVLLKNLQ